MLLETSSIPASVLQAQFFPLVSRFSFTQWFGGLFLLHSGSFPPSPIFLVCFYLLSFLDITLVGLALLGILPLPCFHLMATRTTIALWSALCHLVLQLSWAKQVLGLLSTWVEPISKSQVWWEMLWTFISGIPSSGHGALGHWAAVCGLRCNASVLSTYGH